MHADQEESEAESPTTHKKGPAPSYGPACPIHHPDQTRHRNNECRCQMKWRKRKRGEGSEKRGKAGRRPAAQLGEGFMQRAERREAVTADLFSQATPSLGRARTTRR